MLQLRRTNNAIFYPVCVCTPLTLKCFDDFCLVAIFVLYVQTFRFTNTTTNGLMMGETMPQREMIRTPSRMTVTPKSATPGHHTRHHPAIVALQRQRRMSSPLKYLVITKYIYVYIFIYLYFMKLQCVISQILILFVQQCEFKEIMLIG